VWKLLSESVDDMVLAWNRVFDPPAFRASITGAAFPVEDLQAEQRARPPIVHWPQRFERRVGRLRVEQPVCGVTTYADFHPALDPQADTLFIYHHGLGEFPHDGSAAAILGRGRLRERVDWIAIKGAHHDSLSAVFGRLLESLTSFAHGLFSSVAIARALARHLRPRYRHVVLGGMSMGGVITLIESATGSEFDLALPIVAGPDLGSVCFRGVFSRVVCPRFKRRAARERLASEIDVTPRLAGDGPPIRVVLARYDRLFLFEDQMRAYARVPRAQVVETLAGGHITGAVQFSAISQAFEQALEREVWGRSPAPSAAGRPPLAAVA
jgi:hypothetical protein